MFGARASPCSSTKGATGHTLGAAGALEAVICALALREGFMPGGVNTRKVDPALPVNYLLRRAQRPLQHVLSNSFGFGGTQLQPDLRARPDERDAALCAYVDGIGLLGPGLRRLGCRRAAVLRGARALVPQRRPCCRRPTACPPAERRRAGSIVRLALAVGQDALRQARAQAAPAADRVHLLGRRRPRTATRSAPTLRPPSASSRRPAFTTRCTTRPPATGASPPASTASSDALCAYDASFAAGLLEALTQVVTERTPVLLIAYDTPYPEPLRRVRPIPDAFAIALLLAAGGPERHAGPNRGTLERCATDADRANRSRPCAAASRPRAACRCCSTWRAARSGTVVLEYLEPLQARRGGDPVPLDHAWIEQHIPHKGRMCLLDDVLVLGR